MGDYPDYTSLMQIIGSDIMVPIDIQGAYIMMPVDLQAQYITLEIDVVAQSMGNLTVDINAQTVGDITINFNAQSIGMYVIRDWEAKVDNDKSITGEATIDPVSESNLIDYTVPGNSIFYIDDLSVSGYGDGDITLSIGGTELFHMAFQIRQPLVIIYTTPKKAVAGEHIIIKVYNAETGERTFYANIGGREIAV